MILMSHVREFSLNPKSSFNEAEREPMPYAKDRNNNLAKIIQNILESISPNNIPPLYPNLSTKARFYSGI